VRRGRGGRGEGGKLLETDLVGSDDVHGKLLRNRVNYLRGKHFPPHIATDPKGKRFDLFQRKTRLKALFSRALTHPERDAVRARHLGRNLLFG
jgi:hypothetical protein